MSQKNMKTISKLFILSAVVFTMLFASSVIAAQNPSYPSPSQCNGADWNIGLPNDVQCASSVSAIELNNNAKATSIFGASSRLKPDLTSLNKFCKEYTGDNTAYATYGRMHNYCTSCNQNLSWYNGSNWITNIACAGTLNVQDVRCATGCSTTTCSTHSTKQCSGNVVYWYDSCGAKEDIFQVCASNQICQNAQCVNIACSTNADCGINGYIGSPYCQGNSVYQNYKTYTCNNPGTVNSVCSDSTAPKLKSNCTGNQTCSNGKCVDQNIACSSNSECGTNGYIGNPYCQGNSVYQNYKTYTCNNPGTVNSVCSDSTAPQLKTNCTGNQTCSNGSCTNQNIACSSNTECGANGYTGSPFCMGNSVYQNYKTYTCNNAGTANSYCSNSTAAQLKTNCASGQTCSNGQCQDENIICSTNSQCGTNGYIGSPFCMGNSVYQNYKTYTCNNAGTNNSYCSNNTAAQFKSSCIINQTCSNGYCSTQQNYTTVQTNSATNVYNNQATLNGYLSGINTNNISYVWFQWGTTTSYSYNGYETNHQAMNHTGSFSQNIAGLSPGVVYHFRAVAQDHNGQIIYGQNMTFQIGQVLGATDISTGLTNNFLVDSFFLPLMIALAGIWLFKSGILNIGAWADGKKIKHKNYVASKELKTKINEIKERENLFSSFKRRF